MIFDFILDFQVSTISALIIVAIVLEILFKEFLNSVKCQMWYACFLTNAGEYQISGGIKSSCYVISGEKHGFLLLGLASTQSFGYMSWFYGAFQSTKSENHCCIIYHNNQALRFMLQLAQLLHLPTLVYVIEVLYAYESLSPKCRIGRKQNLNLCI